MFIYDKHTFSNTMAIIFLSQMILYYIFIRAFLTGLFKVAMKDAFFRFCCSNVFLRVFSIFLTEIKLVKSL